MSNGSHWADVFLCDHDVVVPFLVDPLGVHCLKSDLRHIDLERVDRTQVQVRKIAYYVAVDPVFYFTIVLPGRVSFHH